MLAHVARAIAWTDDASDAPDRKRQSRPIPLVGGTAILVGIAVTAAWNALPDFETRAPIWLASERGVDAKLVWLALAVAFLVGLVDDVRPRGIGPLAKLGGQTFAAIVLASAGPLRASEPSILATCACVIGAIAAMNVFNAFDNHDGAATSAAALGLAAAGIPGAGAACAFLCANVAPRRARAYLGDSGSHFLGVLLFATPLACGALVLPALDCARVVCIRLREHRPIWRGDRSHLAHALEARGLSRFAIVALLTGCGAPAAIGVRCGGTWSAIGVLATTAGFVGLALHAARAR
jgi:UDP-GlcNAc:undecaprenyl-phosphate GlcNAc-1-phosphate transferase